jgi:hypothetical protein
MKGLWLLAMGAWCTACGGDRRSATTRVDSAGVEIVTYAGPDVPLAWSFDSLFALGGADSGAQSFYQLRGGVVGADAAGSIYVLDAAAKRIVMFDSAGGFLRAMGRPGAGPGEMQWPIALVVTPDGRAAAFDISTGGLAWFGAGGEAGERVPLQGLYNGGTIRATEAGLLLPSRKWDGDPADPGRNELLRIAGGDTVRLVSVPNAGGKVAQFKSCGMSISGVAPIFAPSVRWAAAGDRVAVTTVAGYDFMLLAGADTTQIVRRPLEPEAATAEAAARSVGDRFRVMSSAGEIACKTDEVVSELGFAERIPIIAEIASGPDGTWWVRRREGAGVDVFAADGGYVGTLPGSAPYPLLSLPGNRIASVVTDELDVDRLVVYRVRK